MALVLCTVLLVWFLAKKNIVINTAIKDGKELNHLTLFNKSKYFLLRLHPVLVSQFSFGH